MSWLKVYTNCSSRCPVFYDHVEACDWTREPPYPWLRALAANTIIALLIVLSVGLAISITRRYNHILLIHRRVHTPSISNTPWILFYLATAVRMVLGLIRGMLYSDHHRCGEVDVALFFSTSAASGTAMVSLCFALDHQLKHRQGAMLHQGQGDYAAAVSLNNPTRTKTVVPGRASACSRAWSWVALRVYVVLWFELAVYCSMLMAQLTQHTEIKLILFKVFLGTIWAIHTTKLMQTIAIIADGAEECPSNCTKVKVALASILHGVTALPPTVWSRLIPEPCPMVVATPVDASFVLEGVAMILYFSFMCDEFERIKDTYLPEKFEQIRRNMNNHRRF